MKKESSSKCPNCGFDFGIIKPQSDHYICACKKYCAEFTSEGITILSMSRDYACGYHSGVDITEELFLPTERTKREFCAAE